MRLANRPAEREFSHAPGVTGATAPLIVLVLVERIDPAATALEMTTDSDSLIVSPVRDAARRRKFEAAIAESHRRYGHTLKRLAE